MPKKLEENTIWNKSVQEMFERIATDDQAAKFYEMIAKGYMGAATGYSSTIVKRKFMEMVEREEHDA